MPRIREICFIWSFIYLFICCCFNLLLSSSFVAFFQSLSLFSDFIFSLRQKNKRFGFIFLSFLFLFRFIALFVVILFIYHSLLPLPIFSISRFLSEFQWPVFFSSFHCLFLFFPSFVFVFHFGFKLLSFFVFLFLSHQL